MQIPALVERIAQTAVTGEIAPRRHRLLGASVAAGPHRWIVDLGCGDGPLLNHVAPDRYTGIDGSDASIRRAQRERAGVGREFFVGDITAWPTSELAGADCVVVSSVTHHLNDEQVRHLFNEIVEGIRPEVIWLQDAEPNGILGPLVRKLDRGDYLRTERELCSLLGELRPTRVWEYTNPLRSFRQFLLRLDPG